MKRYRDYQPYLWPFLIVLVLVPACSSEETLTASPNTTSWSMLATWNPSDSQAFAEATIGVGMLDISSDCVLIILENGKSILPVWPEPTSWNASSETIEFVGIHSNHIELRDGDRIMPSGASTSNQELFVSSPYPSCVGEETFILNSLGMIE